jgi:hypothetical protein
MGWERAERYLNPHQHRARSRSLGDPRPALRSSYDSHTDRLQFASEPRDNPMQMSTWSDDLARWDTSGITDEHGRVGRPTGQTLWYPVNVKMDRDCLVWSGNLLFPTRRAVDHTLLTAFIRLADASTEKIASFARRWGVLNICHHALPRAHQLETPVSFPGPQVCRSLGEGRERE